MIGEGEPGDYGFDGGYLNKKSDAQIAKLKEQEIVHCRLAMIGLLGLIAQANASGMSVVDQWAGALVAPEYASKAGYFLPEGI